MKLLMRIWNKQWEIKIQCDSITQRANYSFNDRGEIIKTYLGSGFDEKVKITITKVELNS